MPRKHDAHKDELEGVAQRLREERPQASPLELDRIKTTAMARAKAGTRHGRVGARRLAVASLTVGLLAAGTGGVIAGQSGKSGGNAATAQYGGNCDTNNGNGNNIGSGNGNKDGNGNGNSSFAAFVSRDHKGKDKSGGGSGGNNSSGNGNGNGTGNGNENGNESGNGNNNFNCNENSFNTTTVNESNTTTNNVTNNYNASTVTIAAPSNNGVLSATTTKKTSKHPVKFHINLAHKTKLKKVTLRVNGKVVSVLKGKKASANISIANLPCSATVSVTAVTSSGKTITQTHTYHLC